MTVRRAEWIVGGLITLTAVHLHVVHLWHAGGLWRDEISSLQIALQPTLVAMWQKLQFESFPALLHVVIRVWTVIGLGDNDLHLRWLGLGIGLGLLASLWCAAWWMRRGVPIVSLALLACNVTVIRWGDSLRAYSLGSILIVLTLALLWLFTRKPNLRSGLVAALAAMLSVQCLYQNAFLVFAACSGACAVCALQRQWRKALWVVSIGAASAISLLPYVPTIIQQQEWSITAKAVGFQAALAWEKASMAMGLPLAWFNFVWVLLVVLAMVIALVAIRRGSKTSPVSPHRELALYAVVAMVVGLASFILFLKIASLPTQPWYYIVILAFVAVCLDTILAVCRQGVRVALITFAVLNALAAYPLGLPAMNYRLTNVDLLAASLPKEMSPNDFIIVHPWYCGTTFHRYFKGGTPWTTLPPLEDYHLQRLDLFKSKMQSENPIQPVLDKVASTLQSSNRVWLVGWIPLNGTPPPDLRPAPNNPWGWADEPYSQIWAAQAGYFIVNHATQGTNVFEPLTNCNPFENLRVVLITGWRPPPPLTTPP